MSSKDDFKATFAAESYKQLYQIFARAPDSPDKDKAIELLKQAFQDHYNLWLILQQKKAQK